MKVNVTYWCKASLRPGDVADLPDAVAQALIRDKHATPADGQPEPSVSEPAGPAPDGGSDTESAGQKARRGRLPVPHKHEPKPDDGE